METSVSSLEEQVAFLHQKNESLFIENSTLKEQNTQLLEELEVIIYPQYLDLFSQNISNNPSFRSSKQSTKISKTNLQKMVLTFKNPD